MKTIMLIVAILIFGASVYWFFTQSKPTKNTPTPLVTQTEITNTQQTENRPVEELQPRISAPTEIAPTENSPLVCTMDVQQCPDGSYVGRVPPSCGFAQCPVRTTPPPTNK